MAEFIMKYLVHQAGLEEQFIIDSAATTTEELGNDMYPNAKAELKRNGIPFERRKARQLLSDEYDDWDFIIAMNDENLLDINYVIGIQEILPEPIMIFIGVARLYLRDLMNWG